MEVSRASQVHQMPQMIRAQMLPVTSTMEAKPAPVAAAPVRKVLRPTRRLESRLLVMSGLLCRMLAAASSWAYEDRTQIRCVSELRSIGAGSRESICARLSRHQSDERGGASSPRACNSRERRALSADGKCRLPEVLRKAGQKARAHRVPASGVGRLDT